MKKEINRIVQMYLQGRFSPETEEKVQKWLIAEKDEKEKEEASRIFWEHLFVLPDKQIHSLLEQVKTKAGIRPPAKKLFTWRTQIAAILIPFILLAGGALWYDRATFWQEVVVPYGQQQQLTLADGSTVSLNAGSTLRYPKRFNKKERQVYLAGEAYFDVIAGKATPFRVESGQQTVKVTGTGFNIKAYPEDEQIVTTLYTGRIEVSPEGETPYVLQPLQQLSYNKTNRITIIREVLQTETNNWRDGSLIFTNTPLDEIWRTLERRFNIQIVQEPAILIPAELYTIRFLKNDSLVDILTVLQETVGKFRYEINGNQITVIK